MYSLPVCLCACKSSRVLHVLYDYARCAYTQVQQARIKAKELAAKATDVDSRRSKLRDFTAVSLLSLIPPDRVGLIRKLRIGHTLKRVPASASEPAGWRIDLTKQRDGHKTSRFYGKSPLSCEKASQTETLDSAAESRDASAHTADDVRLVGARRPLRRTSP